LSHRRPAVRPSGDKTISNEGIDSGAHRTPMDPQIGGQRSLRRKMLSKTVHSRADPFGKDTSDTLGNPKTGRGFRRIDNIRRIRGHAV